MYGLLLSLMVAIGLFLGVVILLQSGKGGGLAAMGGGSSATDGILAGRQATTVLTRATWISGGLFMVLALVLSILSSRSQQPTSIIRPGLEQAAPIPTPVVPDGGAAGADIPPGEGSGNEGTDSP